MTEDGWTEADDAFVVHEMLGDEHPVRLLSALWVHLVNGADISVLREFVTPEGKWGNFSESIEYARQMDAGAGISDRVDVADNAPDVIYMRIIHGLETKIYAPESNAVGELTNVTAVWRPELGGWKIYQIGGDKIAAERLPRSADGASAPTM